MKETQTIYFHINIFNRLPATLKLVTHNSILLQATEKLENLLGQHF